MNSRRGYLITWLALVLGGAAMLYSYRMPWFEGREALTTGGFVDFSGSGLDIAPIGGVMGIVVLAAALAFVVTSGVLRRITAIFAALAGLVGAGSAIRWIAEGGGPQGWLATSGGAVTWTNTVWWLISALCALAVVAASVWAAMRGPRWSTMSTRYDRGARQPRDAWEALDRGLDPTLDE